MHDLIANGIFWPALGIFVLAGFSQGLAGFGLALLGVPLLAIFKVPPAISVPLVTMLTVPVSGHMVQQLRAHIDWPRALWMGIPTVLLAPLGVYLLKVQPATHLYLGIGVLLIGSAIYSWVRARQARAAAVALEAQIDADLAGQSPAQLTVIASGEPAPATGSAVVASGTAAPLQPSAGVKTKLVTIGAVSGVLGGAVGMNGPLIADYLNKSGIQPSGFKVTLNLIFFVSAVTRIALYVGQGVLEERSLWLALITTPVALVASYAGGQVTRRLRPETFARGINVMLVLIGVYMLYKGVKGA